jgi:hypothetical protein
MRSALYVFGKMTGRMIAMQIGFEEGPTKVSP